MGGKRKAITIRTNNASGVSASTKNIISNWRKVEPKLISGYQSEFDAWMDAAVFAHKNRISASAYARAVSEVSKTSENSIRQYVGACLVLLRKFHTPDAVRAEILKRYEYVNIVNARSIANGLGQRSKSATATIKPHEAVTLTRAEASKRLAKYPKAMRDDIIKALGIK